MNQQLCIKIGGLLIATTLCHFPVTGMAWTCEGGTIVTANRPTDAGCTTSTCNGRRFCMSEGAVNWWTGFTWCASNGLTFANYAVMCPPGNLGVTTCPNLNLGISSRNARSSTTTANGGGVEVSLSDGKAKIGATALSKNQTHPWNRAFCLIPEEEE